MKKVFFTGHRNFIKLKIPVRINDIIEYNEKIREPVKILYKLALDGVVDFYAGGALGWDLACAMVITEMRKNGFLPLSCI